jgi:hypothetical protein
MVGGSGQAGRYSGQIGFMEVKKPDYFNNEAAPPSPNAVNLPFVCVVELPDVRENLTKAKKQR